VLAWIKAKLSGFARLERVVLSETVQSEPRAWYRTEQRDSVLRLILGGEWVIDDASALDSSLRVLQLGSAREVEVDGSGIKRMDSTGAFLLVRTERELTGKGAKLRVVNIP
jgi:phospholipid/cholesterol/gamma-HCH transport system permease protein